MTDPTHYDITITMGEGKPPPNPQFVLHGRTFELEPGDSITWQGHTFEMCPGDRFVVDDDGAVLYQGGVVDVTDVTKVKFSIGRKEP